MSDESLPLGMLPVGTYVKWDDELQCFRPRREGEVWTQDDVDHANASFPQIDAFNVRIASGEEWPAGISDGLVSTCYRCGRRPEFDFTVLDEAWATVVPQEWRAGVVCLPCFDVLGQAMGFDSSRAIQRVQWTGYGHTVVLVPQRVYRYSPTKTTDMYAPTAVVPDKEEPETEWNLLHRLWSKAVGQPGYVKAQWQRLEAVLLRTGVGPGWKRGQQR